MRISEQILWEGGIWTTFEDGSQALLPYKVDEHGNKYADIDPNRDFTTSDSDSLLWELK